MSMLPRLKPKEFYDLVVEVAIVRPGPIQGKMVHPYLRRRNGEEPVEYPSDAVREVLEKTLGVPLFQEQAMRLVVVAAGFTPGEADQLRRAMGAWRRNGAIDRFEQKLIEGMLANGYTRRIRPQPFSSDRRLRSYGFPESHAASFALLVYVSAWIKCHHPAVFLAALLNSQPMGFYGPAQLVADARRHGVEVLPSTSITATGIARWSAARDGKLAVRLGWSTVKGLSQTAAETDRPRAPAGPVPLLWRFRCTHPPHDGGPLPLVRGRCVPLARPHAHGRPLDVAGGDTTEPLLADLRRRTSATFAAAFARGGSHP